MSDDGTLNTGASLRDRAGRPTDQAPAGLGEPATIPSAEVGFVEYRSLAHALWTEGLSTYRSWRFSRRLGLGGPQKWYGVYVGGTEIRLAAVGPWSLSCAEMIASAIEARRAATAQTGAVHESAVAESETPTRPHHPPEGE